MKLFWTLTRAQLRGLLSSVGNSNTRKTRPRSAWLMLGLLALLALYLSGTYSFALASVLGGTGNLDLVLELMPFVGAGFTVLLGAQSAGTFVFAGRDNDLLLALPIPRLTLALAKLAAVLLENLLFMLCMVLPAGLAYALATPTPAWLWPAEVLGAALLALVTTALSVALGLVITVVNNLRQGTTIVNVLGMLLLLGFVAGSLVGQVPLMKSLEADPAPVRAWIGTWTPPLTWVRDVAVDGSLPALALLVLATVVPFAGVAWLVGRSFVALVGQATAKRGGVRKVAVSSMRARTPFVALVRRESQRFFGSSIYFLNTGFGLAMLLLGAGYLIVIRELPAGFAEVARAARSAVRVRSSTSRPPSLSHWRPAESRPRSTPRRPASRWKGSASGSSRRPPCPPAPCSPPRWRSTWRSRPPSCSSWPSSVRSSPTPRPRTPPCSSSCRSRSCSSSPSWGSSRTSPGPT